MGLHHPREDLVGKSVVPARPANLSGVVAGSGVWVTAPAPTADLDYGLLRAARVVFAILLILAGVIVSVDTRDRDADISRTSNSAKG